MASERLNPSKAYPGACAARRFFRWNGEKRPPRKGEWYLSGAIITAYRTEGDGMTYPYHIAVEVDRTGRCEHCGASL